MEIPDDDLGRAFLAAGNTIGHLHYVADGLAGRTPPGPHSIEIPVAGEGKPKRLRLEFRGRPSPKDAALSALRDKLPLFCHDVIQSFPPVRFELSGLTDNARAGSYSGASLHFIVWVIAQDFFGAMKADETHECVETLDHTIDFDQLMGGLEAEYSKARRNRDRSVTTKSDAGKKRGRRRKVAQEPRPLTAKQTEAFTMVTEFGGSVAKAARALGRDPSTVRDHYKAALRKLGKRAVKSATHRLPRGRRGEEAISEEDDRRG